MANKVQGNLSHFDEFIGLEACTWGAKTVYKSTESKHLQLSFFQMDDPLLLDIKHIIESIDINSISPLDAFDTIRQIKNKLNGGKEDGIVSQKQK